jgi:TonB-dependent SusC/RagA subfamily outer membrane receptor
MEGRISGISIGANSINIRGTSTIDGGPTPALLVVDGTVVNFSVFSNIPTEQVKSIDVLKGASASARYGSRGMGGVIVVTTKSEN